MILITRPKEQYKSIEVSLNSKGYKTYLESLYKIKYFKKKVSCNKNNYYICNYVMINFSYFMCF